MQHSNVYQKTEWKY